MKSIDVVALLSDAMVKEIDQYILEKLAVVNGGKLLERINERKRERN